MTNSFSVSKCTPPEIDRFVLRPRLFDRLDEACLRSVIWITGPPGSGKTSLIATYVQRRNKPFIWYQLDETDNDPASFFTGLATAAKPISKVQDAVVSTLTPEHLQNLATFSGIFFERFVLNLPAAFDIVLDNYHLLDQGSSVHAFAMDMLTSFSPKEVNMFIVSRNCPPDASVKMLVEQRVSFLFWNELRFTLEESKSLLGSDNFSDEVINLLHQKTDGWAAGLVLLGESLRRGGRIADTTPWVPMEDVFNYLALEVFHKIQPEIRDFLIKTAFLSKMTVDMASTLTGSEQAENILIRLFQNNYFTTRHLSSIPEYEYHPLFSQFLRFMAGKESAPEELKRLICRSAAILESSGQLEEAVSLLRSVGETELIVQVTLKHAERMVSEGRFRTLANWISAVEQSFWDKEPWLAYWMATCLQFTDSVRSRDYYELAFEKFRAVRDEKGMLSAWCGAVDTCIYDGNDFLFLEGWIAALERLLKEGLAIPSSVLGTRTAVCMLGALVYVRPEHAERIRVWLELALRQPHQQFNGHDHLHVGFHAAYHAMWTGDLTRLRILSENIQRVVRNPETPLFHVLNAKCLEALVFSLCFARGDKALEIVEEGLNLARRHNLAVWDSMLFGQGVFAALPHGDVPAAERHLAKMESVTPRNKRFSRAHYHYTAASFHLYCGNLVLAELDIEKALITAEQVGARYTLPFFALVKAQICHEMGDYEGREQIMEMLKINIAGSCSRIQEFMWLICKAYFSLESNLRTHGLDYLRTAFHLGRREGYLNMFWWWRPDMMARLCATALKHGIEVEYARLLIRCRNLFPDSPPLEIFNWPWGLRIHTLGRFELVKEEQVLLFEGKMQHRPLALLKALVVAGRYGASENELSDLLWPDSEGDRAHSVFTTTLSRLRKLLGAREFLVVQGGGVFLNGRTCWVDAWAFMELCGRVFELASRNRLEEGDDKTNEVRINFYSLASQAQDLYRGHFLQMDLNYPWTIPTRERLRNKFHDLIASLGDVLERSGDLEQARQCYLRALEVDDLHEDFYGRLMVCAQKMNRKKEVVATYHRCRERLREVFDMKPSLEIQKLARSLGCPD
ncbi:transcriptional activator domain-containing protein [Desulfonatronum zhilinae]|nr:transcriptional activator domain-containing protein [Desulfonatronum zhilinae]